MDSVLATLGALMGLFTVMRAPHDIHDGYWIATHMLLMALLYQGWKRK